MARPRLIEGAHSGRRAQIVTAAATVLAREGYEATSMKQIADEIGVASGLLHYYFGTKEDLLVEVVSQLHQEVDAAWHAAVAGIEDPLDRVAAATDAAARRFAEQPAFWRLLVDMYSVGLRNQKVRERLRAMSDAMSAQIEREIDEINARAPVPNPLPKEDMAAAVMGSIDGIAALALIRGTDAAGAFRALKASLVSFVAMAYVAGGEPLPLDRVARHLLPPEGAVDAEPPASLSS